MGIQHLLTFGFRRSIRIRWSFESNPVETSRSHSASPMSRDMDKLCIQKSAIFMILSMNMGDQLSTLVIEPWGIVMCITSRHDLTCRDG